jgi:hypothetical protein
MRKIHYNMYGVQGVEWTWSRTRVRNIKIFGLKPIIKIQIQAQNSLKFYSLFYSFYF